MHLSKIVRFVALAASRAPSATTSQFLRRFWPRTVRGGEAVASPIQTEYLMRLPLHAAAIALLLPPGLAVAGDTHTVCQAEFPDADGQASVETQVLNGAPVSTTAAFMPMFHATISAVDPARIPDVTKPDGETPNAGAYPSAKIYYEYLTMADGRHTLPAYRLRLEVPVYVGGENQTAFFKVRVGTWEGGKLVSRRDVSAIVGLPDVPVYGVDLEIRPFDTRSADPDSAALEAALRQVDHADIEIHEGSADGPLKIRGTIGLAAQHDRLLAVAGALQAAGAKLAAGSCDRAD